MQFLMVMGLKHIFTLRFEVLNFVFQVRLCMNDLLRKVDVRLLDPQTLRELVH